MPFRKAFKQDNEDVQMAASNTAGSASTSSAADASGEPFEVRYPTDKDKLNWKFLDEVERKPVETRRASIEERLLARYIRHNVSTLHAETRTRLNDLADPAGCAAFAEGHLMQLERHTCSPPADLVRILQVIAQIPAESVILKEKFEFIQEDARSHDKTKRQTVRWRNSGIRLRPTPPFHLKHGKASQTKNAFAIAPILPHAYRARGSPRLLEWRCTSCSTAQKIFHRLLLRMPLRRTAPLRTFPNSVRMADGL